MGSFERVTVRGSDGSSFTIPKIEAIMAQATNQAAKGDMKAMRTCFQVLNMFPDLTEPEPSAPTSYYIEFVESLDEQGNPLPSKKEKKFIPFDEYQKLHS
jgi:hypothetical protein